MEIGKVVTSANGFLIEWEKEGVGYGQLSFNGDKIDSEYMGEDFCNEVFAAFVKKYLPKEFKNEKG
jgi:hypothetical protein